MKEKIKVILPIFIIVILILGVAFYWYEWKPTAIRKECWNRVEKIKKGEIKSDKFVSDEFQAQYGNKQVIDALYIDCLRENGIDK